jgi:hypothetical protein
MRTLAFVGGLLGMFVVTGCNGKPSLEEAEALLTKTYSNTSATMSFKCRDGERDWLYICQFRMEPTPKGTKAGIKPTTVERVAIRSMGNYQGRPVLVYRALPDDGPILSQAEQEAWNNVVMAQRKAEAAAYSAKVRERSNRAVGSAAGLK